MNCDKCGTEFEATGTTPEYPDCNTWTCPKCGYVRPELGSLRLADAPPSKPSLADLERAVEEAFSLWNASGHEDGARLVLHRLAAYLHARRAVLAAGYVPVLISREAVEAAREWQRPISDAEREAHAPGIAREEALTHPAVPLRYVRSTLQGTYYEHGMTDKELTMRMQQENLLNRMLRLLARDLSAVLKSE